MFEVRLRGASIATISTETLDEAKREAWLRAKAHKRTHEVWRIQKVYTVNAEGASTQTLHGQMAAIYAGLDAEDCAMVDRAWAKWRGINLQEGSGHDDS